MDGSNVVLTGLSDPNSCIAHWLNEYGASVNSIVWNSADDTIAFSLNFGFDINITLKKTATFFSSIVEFFNFNT